MNANRLKHRRHGIVGDPGAMRVARRVCNIRVVGVARRDNRGAANRLFTTELGLDTVFDGELERRAEELEDRLV